MLVAVNVDALMSFLEVSEDVLGIYLPEMRLSRGHACHCFVVSMLMRIIEDLERSWLQFLCDLIVVRKHTQRPASIE